MKFKRGKTNIKRILKSGTIRRRKVPLDFLELYESYDNKQRTFKNLEAKTSNDSNSVSVNEHEVFANIIYA